MELKNPAKTQLDFEFKLAVNGRNLANELNGLWPEKKPSVGMIAVGGFALKYTGKTIDLMGLNNILMGHSPGDRKGIKNHAAFNKDVFYQLNPDILLPVPVSNLKEAGIQYSCLLDSNNFENQAMKNIFNDTDFQKSYYPVFISGNTNTGIFVFANKDFANRLQSDTGLSLNKIYIQ
jgi:hypothetical protein